MKKRNENDINTIFSMKNNNNNNNKTQKSMSKHKVAFFLCAQPTDP